jgi:hypothetical protein
MTDDDLIIVLSTIIAQTNHQAYPDYAIIRQARNDLSRWRLAMADARSHL